MPGWLSWKLFWKVAPYVAILLALGAAVAFIDHRGYKRAEEQAKLDNALADKTRLEFKLRLNEEVTKLNTKLNTLRDDLDFDLQRGIQDIRTHQTNAKSALIKEIQSNVRFSDPAAGISDGMLASINRARAATNDACSTLPDGGISCVLPPAEPVE